jgi:hypothetical protein
MILIFLAMGRFSVSFCHYTPFGAIVANVEFRRVWVQKNYRVSMPEFFL